PYNALDASDSTGGRQTNPPPSSTACIGEFQRRFSTPYVELSGFAGPFSTRLLMSQASAGLSRRWSKLMRTREASAYLAEVHGVQLSEATLNKLGCVGGGPKYFKDGRYPGYPSEFLDTFAQARLGAPRSNTSDPGQLNSRAPGSAIRRAPDAVRLDAPTTG